MNSTEAQVRERTQAYVTGAITLRDLEDVLVPLAWDGASDTEVDDLVAQLELVIAEFTGGAWSEAEAKARLEDIVGEIASTTKVYRLRPEQERELAYRRSSVARNELLAVAW